MKQVPLILAILVLYAIGAVAWAQVFHRLDAIERWADEAIGLWPWTDEESLKQRQRMDEFDRLINPWDPTREPH